MAALDSSVPMQTEADSARGNKKPVSPLMTENSPARSESVVVVNADTIKSMQDQIKSLQEQFKQSDTNAKAEIKALQNDKKKMHETFVVMEKEWATKLEAEQKRNQRPAPSDEDSSSSSSDEEDNKGNTKGKRKKSRSPPLTRSAKRQKQKQKDKEVCGGKPAKPEPHWTNRFGFTTRQDLKMTPQMLIDDNGYFLAVMRPSKEQEKHDVFWLAKITAKPGEEKTLEGKFYVPKACVDGQQRFELVRGRARKFAFDPKTMFGTVEYLDFIEAEHLEPFKKFLKAKLEGKPETPTPKEKPKVVKTEQPKGKE